jgi:Flp pilus assembly secretin CpaC
MLMLEAFREVQPRKKTRFPAIAGGILVLAALGAALPTFVPQQEQGSALVEVLAGGRRTKDLRSITEGSDAYLTFSKDIRTLASGNDKVLRIAQPSNASKRAAILNALAIGRTSLTVWYEDGGSEQLMVSVTRDLSVLESALRSIAPTISAEIASDRDAIVLIGTAPDQAAAKRAVEAAESYVKASKGEGGGQGQVIDLLKLQTPATTLESRIEAELARMGVSGAVVRRVAQGSSADDSKDVFILEGAAPDLTTAGNAPQLAARLLPGEGKEKDQRVVNRVTISNVPMSVEQVMQSAIRELGCPKVNVRRVVSTEFPGDGDIVVLEGSVPTQTHLVRTVTLAAKIFQQQELVKRKRDGEIEIIREFDASGQTRVTEKQLELDDSADDIKVIADESGGLHSEDDTAFGGAGNAVGAILGAGSRTNSSSNNMQRLLENRLETNIARAKALEMADGRVLSFLTVEDIPAVRVDIKLYEINRTALLDWNSQQAAAITDFDTGSTLRDPGFVQNPVTGDFIEVPGSVPVNNPDVRDAIGFLAGGFVNRLQISGESIQLDSLLRLLEREGIARSLSSPQLTVLSGELAFFGVGGTVPIESSVVTEFGSGVNVSGTSSGILNTVAEREFGIRLSVRPLVEEDGMITLDVVPSVSQPDAQLTLQIRETTGETLSTTAFQERSLRTSARLRDGQALMIGGLTSHSRTDNSSQTPGLHQIPIIGFLFKQYSYDDNDRELVIVVNPVIVREPPTEAPLWAFPDVKELMRTLPTPENLAAKRKADEQKRREKAEAEAARKAAEAEAAQAKKQ